MNRWLIEVEDHIGSWAEDITWNESKHCISFIIIDLKAVEGNEKRGVDRTKIPSKNGRSKRQLEKLENLKSTKTFIKYKHTKKAKKPDFYLTTHTHSQKLNLYQLSITRANRHKNMRSSVDILFIFRIFVNKAMEDRYVEANTSFW